MIVLGATLAAAGLTTPMFTATPSVGVVFSLGSGSASGTVTLANETLDPITISSFVRDATCDAAVGVAPVGSTFPFTVAGMASKLVNINCAAMQAPGIQRCLIHVRDQNGAQLVEFEVACEYSSTPTLVPSTTGLMFGSVTIGDTVRLPVLVENQSPTSITKLLFHIDDLEGNFKIGSPCNPDGRECDATIAGVSQGNSAGFDVLCSPVSSGTHVARLYVASNTGQHLPGTPDVIDLSCTGIAASTPVISVTPNSIDVGNVNVIGAIASSGIHIKNVGGGTLQLTDVRIVDGGSGAAADWSYIATGPCIGMIPGPCDLTAEQQVDLDVSFDPSAIGARDATLLIAYRDTADRSASVPLSGIGRGATLELVGGNPLIDFGVVPINATSQVTFQLANHGNRVLSDATLGITPSGTPFTLTPPTMAIVSPTTPTTITAACKPTTSGTFTATFRASAPDAFMSPPIAITATCEGTSTPLHGSPTTIQLGEVRTGTSPALTPITLLSAGAPLSITSVALESSTPKLAIIAATPVATPAPIQLRVDPIIDGSLSNAIVVTASNGNLLRIPIAGEVVTATYLPPPAVSLGTFCVNQPTTPRPIELLSTGTATIRLLEPVMERGSMSPFDLTLIAPSLYPSTIGAGGTASVQLTPRRQAVAGVHTDDLVWTTDVATLMTARTQITATFVDNGGAIAPPALSFGPVPIHIYTKNGQSVTLQNCDTTPVVIEDPAISPPFSIDSTNFPTVLLPNESATFSVGFHPTRVGLFSRTLTIESPQLQGLLVIALSGEGITTGIEIDAGTDDKAPGTSSCAGCNSKHPTDGILLVLTIIQLMVVRRRGR